MRSRSIQEAISRLHLCRKPDGVDVERSYLWAIETVASDYGFNFATILLDLLYRYRAYEEAITIYDLIQKLLHDYENFDGFGKKYLYMAIIRSIRQINSCSKPDRLIDFIQISDMAVDSYESSLQRKIRERRLYLTKLGVRIAREMENLGGMV